MTMKTYNSEYEFQGNDLHKEAQYLEARIEQMGFEGDCIPSICIDSQRFEPKWRVHNVSFFVVASV